VSTSRLSKEQRQQLTRILDYPFPNSPELLDRALTHRSSGADNYERLEFLGDSILNFVIAEAICDRFHDTGEGKLSRLRASLVRRSTLAEIGRELDLGRYLILGSGELKSGGHDRDSILEDVLEALIGAIYRDGGIAVARSFVLRIFARRLDEADPTATHKDPKTRLQEFLQKRGQSLPEYRIVAIEGAPHEQRFSVECVLNEGGRYAGEGASRRKAEQAAARRALCELESSSSAMTQGGGRPGNAG